MKLTLRQFDRPAKLRGAFTLTELLVAMGIFVILATLTVGAFRTNNQDRVGNAAGNFKNALEGARSRAINSGEVRGLRLLKDPNDFRIVTSMVYVGAPEHLEGTVNIGNVNTTTTITNTNPGEWNPLVNRNLIRNGNRIELPRGSGRWYEVSGAGGNTLIINGFYQPSRWNGSNFVAVDSTSVPYKLELSPSVLEGAEPVPFDPKTCIDLDGSRLPSGWRFIEDLDGDGQLQTSMGEPDANMSGQFELSVGYSDFMDILFSPDGTLAGDLATEGVLHFRIASRSDVLLAQPLRVTSLGGSFTAATYPSFIVTADPENDHKALSIFTRTGTVVINEIDRTNDDGDQVFNEQIANNPFRFALSGKEAN